MSEEYPKMLYTLGGTEMVFGQQASFVIVEDADGEAAAKRDGYVTAEGFAAVLADPLDHDGDGRKGGSRRRAKPDETDA